MKLTKKQQELVDKIHGLTMQKLAASEGFTHTNKTRTTKQRSEMAKKAAKTKRKKYDADTISEWGKSAGNTSYEMGVGIHSLTYEQRVQNSKDAIEKARSTNSGVFQMYTCKHCSRETQGIVQHTKHESTCILSKVSLDEFKDEMINPTMERKEYASSLGMGASLMFRSFKDLQDRGLISSELQTTGNKRRNNSHITCPHCKKQGTDTDLFKRGHFDDCIFTTIDKKELTKDILSDDMKMDDVVIKWGIKKNTLITFKNGHKLFKVGVEVTCPHCLRKGRGTVFKNIHFDSCVFKNIDLKELNKDMKTLRREDVSKKYNLSEVVLFKYNRDVLTKL
jgi:hypothetical protein